MKTQSDGALAPVMHYPRGYRSQVRAMQITVGSEPEKLPEKEDKMLNLTLLERNYLVELIRKDKKEQNLASQLYVDPDMLIQYLEDQDFVGGTDEETDKPVNLCPDCSVYCVKRFIDGRCE